MKGIFEMRLRLVVAVLLVGVVVLGSPAPAVGGRVRIKATTAKTWNPDFKSVSKGTKVIWKNPTGVRHTVTATSGAWSKDVVLKPGTRTVKIFRKRGAFDYKCKLHQGMTGHIHVD